MRDVTEHYGLEYVPLSGVDKVNGHPTELGMAEICEQILDTVGG